MVHKKIRVGIPQELSPPLRRFFPADAELIRVPDELDAPIEVDFWVLPYMTKTLERVLPFVRGVKVVQALSAGVDYIVDNIPSGATLCDGRGIHDAPVAEWVVGALLSSLKYFQLYEDVRRREEWKGRFAAEDAYERLHSGYERQPLPILGEDLAGKHVLLVRHGSIGEAVERRLAPFEVSLARIGRNARADVSPIDDLDKLLPDADIVIVLVPLTAETERMFDAARIAKMKQSALLVNAARGPVVDTVALVAALRAYKVRAALDVTEPEPLPAGHPLWKAPNLFLTPHIAGGGPGFFERAYKLAGEQVARYMKGEPLLNVVTGGY